VAVYAVGDIQGCYGPFRKLLDKISFDPAKDRLWCVGDLVNRGPQSLEVLRYIKSLGNTCICVLGNHDLHLLGQAAGKVPYASKSLKEVLKAPDRIELIDWLRHRPLMHDDKKMGWCMVHAGLHPAWSLKKTKRRAAEVEEVLQSRDWRKFCRFIHWCRLPERDPEGKLMRRIFTASVLTRGRYCTAGGKFNWSVRDGRPEKKTERPWYSHDELAWRGKRRIVYGHWAAAGLVTDQPHVLGLDTGCVWGGRLTAVRLDGEKLKIRQAACKACQPIGT